jgi:hypothetical protein
MNKGLGNSVARSLEIFATLLRFMSGLENKTAGPFAVTLRDD